MTPPASVAATAAAAAAAAAAAQKRIESAKEGDWLILIHVIEAHSLRATDPDGSCDPVVSTCVTMGSRRMKRATRVISKDRNAIFDEFQYELKIRSGTVGNIALVAPGAMFLSIAPQQPTRLLTLAPGTRSQLRSPPCP